MFYYYVLNYCSPKIRVTVGYQKSKDYTNKFKDNLSITIIRYHIMIFIICQNWVPLNTRFDPTSSYLWLKTICGWSLLVKWRRFKCRPTDDRHNKLSADCRKIPKGCSIWRKQNWSADNELLIFTRKIPFWAQKLSHFWKRQFLIWDLGFRNLIKIFMFDVRTTNHTELLKTIFHVGSIRGGGSFFVLFVLFFLFFFLFFAWWVCIPPLKKRWHMPVSKCKENVG